MTKKPRPYFVHVGSQENGGDIFGEYPDLNEAGEAVKRLAIKAFDIDQHNVGARSYTIIQAAHKTAAERVVSDNEENFRGFA